MGLRVMTCYRYLDVIISGLSGDERSMHIMWVMPLTTVTWKLKEFEVVNFMPRLANAEMHYTG